MLVFEVKSFLFSGMEICVSTDICGPAGKKNAFECSEQFWVEGTKPRFCNVYGNSIKCKRY